MNELFNSFAAEFAANLKEGPLVFSHSFTLVLSNGVHPLHGLSHIFFSENLAIVDQNSTKCSTTTVAFLFGFYIRLVDRNLPPVCLLEIKTNFEINCSCFILSQFDFLDTQYLLPKKNFSRERNIQLSSFPPFLKLSRNCTLRF